MHFGKVFKKYQFQNTFFDILEANRDIWVLRGCAKMTFWPKNCLSGGGVLVGSWPRKQAPPAKMASGGNVTFWPKLSNLSENCCLYKIQLKILTCLCARRGGPLEKFLIRKAERRIRKI